MNAEHDGYKDLKDVYEFSLEVKEVPVKLFDPEHNEERWYVIRECTADERDIWMNSVSGRMRVDDQGNASGVKDFRGMQATLLSLVMYEAEASEGKNGMEVSATKKKVTVGQAQKWPARVQTELFKLAQRICGLDEEAEERAKNE